VPSTAVAMELDPPMPAAALPITRLINAKASRIKTQISNGTMPKTGSITAAQKSTLVCWVNNGALNN
jgi:hypothetical protein